MILPLRLLLLVLALATGFYGAGCLFLYVRQTRMIFFPSSVIEATPGDFDMSFEEVWLPVGNGRVHGWWIPYGQDNPELGVILHLHGNAINMGANLAQAQRFHQLGLSVLMIDYRGYGRSQGDFPNEQQVYQDAEASWRYLTQTRQISPQQIVIYGHSLGGAIAIELASHHTNAAGLIVESSFTSMRQMVDYTSPRSIFPTDLLLTQKFSSLTKVSALQMPLLLIHGGADQKVPAWMSQALYDAASEPKQLYLVPLAAHNDVGAAAGAAYLRVVGKFVQNLVKVQVSSDSVDSATTASSATASGDDRPAM
jgi:fermentation-respiration switch protein FrsA (DUF1100 family)